MLMLECMLVYYIMFSSIYMCILPTKLIENSTLVLFSKNVAGIVEPLQVKQISVRQLDTSIIVSIL